MLTAVAAHWYVDICGHGFAVVRVDIRGSGDSEGHYHGEYLSQEQADCMHVLNWIAGQPWCTGSIGMYGKSWGGFNGLQMASLRPALLKSVVSLYSTDDRYATDVHYQGGAIVAYQMLSWSSVMFSYDARPPNPNTVRGKQDCSREEHVTTVARVRDVWRERLDASTGPSVQEWMAHPLRDEYWQHGSAGAIGVDGQDTIAIPTLLIGGMADGYTDTVFRMLANQPEAQRGTWRALVGPWGHDWPDSAAPGPNIGYLQELVQWWSATLKNDDPFARNLVASTPLLRTFIHDLPPPIPPEGGVPGSLHRKGRWLAMDRFATSASGSSAAAGTWPGCFEKEAEYMRLRLHGSTEALLPETTTALNHDATVRHRGQPLHGSKSGDWLGWGVSGGDDGPDEQSVDDGLSLTLTSAPLADDMILVGFPSLRATVAVDQPVATLNVRLTAVMPEGASWLLSRGTLNLNHVPGTNHAESRAIVPDEPLEVDLDLASVSVRVPAGCRLRLALSPYNWPLIWPAPGPATELSLLPGGVLSLPLASTSATVEWQPARDFLKPLLGPACPTDDVRPAGQTARFFTQEPGSGVQTLTVTENGGLLRLLPRNVCFGEDTKSTYTLDPRASETVGAGALATISRRYETRYDVGDGMVWRTLIVTNSEMADSTDGAQIELRHQMWVYDATCPQGSLELENDDSLSLFWEGDWDAIAPSQAATAFASVKPARL